MASDSLLEAVEGLLPLYRLKVPARLRKTLMLMNSIESMFLLSVQEDEGRCRDCACGAAACSGEEDGIMSNVGGSQKTFNDLLTTSHSVSIHC